MTYHNNVGMQQVLNQTLQTSEKINYKAQSFEGMAQDLSVSPFVKYMQDLKNSIIN